MLKINAHAKINWRLAITGRRADGYHQLHGLMQSISLYDTLILAKSTADQCQMEPPLGVLAQQNLALRAWLLLKERLGLQQCLSIAITKRIPAGGGLGGGSANAAAVLNGANQLLGLGLSLTQLQQLGLELGADIPFCLQGGLALATGIGEELLKLSSPPPLFLLLAHNGEAVSTAEVFAQYKNSGQAFTALAQAVTETKLLTQALLSANLVAIKSGLHNDLQAASLKLYPNLAVVEQALRQLGLEPLMSGSGGVFFALCESEQAAYAAQSALQGKVAWTAVVQTA